MTSITRSKSREPTDKTDIIYETVAELLDKIDKRPIRLVGISLSNLTETPNLQLSMFDTAKNPEEDKLSDVMMKLQLRYGRDIVKSASVLRAEKRIREDAREDN